MATVTGALSTYAAKGNREDLADIIYNISATERPFMSNIEKVDASNTFHEWQTDALATASSTNAVIEGEDATTDTATATVRLGNYCQISDKVPRTTGTQRAVTAAGRRDEHAYQIAKRGQELLRDVESALLGIQPAVAGSASTARACAGVGRWLWTNQVKQGAATTPAVTSGAPTTASTAGTAGTFLEADLKAAVKAAWDQGGNPGVVIVNSFNKQKASAFTGIATQYRDNAGANPGPATIVAGADVYVSDFGTHQIVADRFAPTNNVYVLDLEYWNYAVLRDVTEEPLAKTGDSDRTQLLVEYTLEACAPSASAKIYTTTTS